MVTICNSYLCKLCIVFDLYYLCPRKNNYAYEVPYRNTGFREDYRGRICICVCLPLLSYELSTSLRHCKDNEKNRESYVFP